MTRKLECRRYRRAVYNETGETGRDKLFGERNKKKKKKIVVARQVGVTVERKGNEQIPETFRR